MAQMPREDADGALGLVLGEVEAEERRRVPAPREQVETEQQDARQVADREAGAAQEADAAGRHDVRQHRVREDLRVLVEQVAEDHREGDPHEAGLHAGRREPQQHHRGHADHVRGREPGLAATAGIGDGAEHGRGERDDDRADRSDEAPARLPLHPVRAHGGGEIGREDEDVDEDVVRNAGGVAERPGELGELRGAGSDVAGLAAVAAGLMFAIGVGPP